MRPTVIAGNWKMNKVLQESIELVRALRSDSGSIISPQLRVVICPPFTSLHAAEELLRGSRIYLGAQNMSEHDDGAFTGEVSWRMLKSVGCTYVILGHSERRQFCGENDGLINRKAKKALANGLTPIICIGETLEQREKGIARDVVSSQLKGVLEGIAPSSIEHVIIAYEPVWAIGTGRNATPDQAQEIHNHVRSEIATMYGEGSSRNVVIQYGGSVKPENAAAILAQPDIDGALVGGACLVSESFWAIVRAKPA